MHSGWQTAINGSNHPTSTKIFCLSNFLVQFPAGLFPYVRNFISLGKKKYYISRCTEEIADLISSIIGDCKNNTCNDAQTSIYASLGSAKPFAHEQHEECV